MSLESGGHIVTATVELTDHQASRLVIDPEKDEPVSKKYDTYTYESGAGVDVARSAFMNSMKAFSQSDAFKALMHDLENDFVIKLVIESIWL